MRLEIEDAPGCCAYWSCGASEELGDNREDVDNPDYRVVIREDDLGIPWCQKHWHYSKIINYGAKRGFPEMWCENWRTNNRGELLFDNFYMPEGMFEWLATLTCCDEDRSYILEGMIECLESEEVSHG